MWIEILLGLLGLLALFYWWLTTKWDFWTKQGIYQIKPVFPVGSVPALFTKKEHMNDTFLKQAKETEGMPFYGLYLFGGSIFVVQDADILKNIMVKDFDYFVDRDHTITNKIYKTQQKADILWMEQLTSAQGERWKSIRSTFTPIFTSGKMKAMLVYVQETCKKLTNAMEDYAEKDEAFELKELLGKYSMDTIASCAFGVDSQAFTNKDSKFVEYAQNIFKQSAKDGLKLALVMLPFDLG